MKIVFKRNFRCFISSLSLRYVFCLIVGASVSMRTHLSIGSHQYADEFSWTLEAYKVFV